jgi:hypothetical protein
MISEIADNLGFEEDMVKAVVAEFALQLHRHTLEYPGLSGDLIGGCLFAQLDRQAFYHLLGFLDHFMQHYDWDECAADEYLLRLGSRHEWAPFQHQMAGWRLAHPREKESRGSDPS